MFVNHPGWWDPMTAVLMTELFFPGKRFAAPMDAEALRSYPILESLGFFGISRQSISGIRDLLRIGRTLMRDGDVILWLTPGGQFHDVRREVPFLPGLSHLADGEFSGVLIPMAMEYTFWNERRPELLVRFGPQVECVALPEDREARTQALQSLLGTVQEQLAAAAIGRSSAAFETVFDGRGGIGGFYDVWRWLVARVRGKEFRSRHEVQPENESFSDPSG
jgi:1-acyl-sn-glycerol-3-phosphate acyltransferase